MMATVSISLISVIVSAGFALKNDRSLYDAFPYRSDIDDGLIRSILHVFPAAVNSQCLAIFGDKSPLSERLTSVLLSRTPTVLMDASHERETGCSGMLIIVDDGANLEQVFDQIRISADVRYCCLVRNDSLDAIERRFSVNPRLFKGAEVALFQSDNYKTGLRFDPETGIFEKFDVPLDGSWERSNAAEPTEIRFSTGGCDIHSDVFRNADFTGVDWEVFKSIAQIMNRTVRYVPPLNNSLLGDLDEGNSSAATWNGGIMGNLANDLADIAFCGLWIEWRKFRAGLRMSKPFQQVCIVYAVRRPGLSNDWSLAFNSFKPFVFCGMFVSVIVVGSTTFVVNKMKNVFVSSQIQGFRSWPFCVLTAWGILFHGNTPRSSPKLGSIRRIIIVWAVGTVIFDSSFSSQFMSKLTYLQYDKKPVGIKDLVELGYEGPHVVPYPWDGILNVKEKYSAEWVKRTYFESNFDEYVNRLRTKPKQTILGSMYDKGTFIPASPAPIPEDVLAEYEPMDRCLATVYEGYALRPGSPLNDKFDRFLTRYGEFGLVEHEMRKAMGLLSSQQPVLKHMTVPSNSAKLSPLSLEQLRGIFFAFSVGQALAFLCFLIELASSTLNKSASQQCSYDG